MKRVFKTAMFVVLSAMTVYSCSKEPDVTKPDSPAEGKMIKLTISAGKPGAVDSRTMVAEDGATPMWCPGDALGVSVFGDDSYTNHRFANDNTETASEKTTFSGSTAVGDVVYTYYPYSSAGVTAQGKARLTIPAVQNPSPTSFDGAADLLVGKPAALTPSTAKIEGLQFKRVGGFLKIVLKDDTGGALAGQKIGMLSVTAESPLAGDVYLDIVDGELGGIYAGESATVTAKYTAQTEYAVGETDAAAYLGVYPQTLAAGTTLTVTATTQNFDIEKVVELAEDIDVKEGKITAITVTIGEENISGNSGNKNIEIAEAFPDPIFRAYVLENIDTDHNGILSEEEALAVTEIDVCNYPYDESKCIKSLDGIQYFSNLTELNCYSNQLTTLDVSKNTELTYLRCDNSQLTTLDISKNTELTYLRCDSNQLTTLDVSKNTELETLWCGSNQLATLDVSKNTKLTELNCNSNQLTTLDVSKNTALEVLSCHSNQLATLDVSKNTELTDLGCSSNQLTTLDVSKNTELTDLYCGGNPLTTLDVSKNTALEYLNCSENQLTSLDVSKNTALGGLNCSKNQLTSLDVSKNTALTYLFCGSNELTTLDVSKNTKLTELSCPSNQLTSLDLSKNSALGGLWCHSNQIEELDLSETNLVNSYLIRCAPMESLKIVYLKKGWSIPGFTEDNGRSEDLIPATTKIIFLSGEYGDNGSAGGSLEGGSYEL